MKRFKCLDLFSGAGGISLGFKNVGFDISLSNDYEPKALTLHKANSKTQLICDSIQNLNQSKILKKYDVLLAGFPCQPFSIAGERGGFECKKNGYQFEEILKTIIKTEPKVIFLENVANLLSHNEGRSFQLVQNELANLGFNVKYKLMDSIDYGNLPQSRKRLYIVGFRDTENYNRFTFPPKIKLTKSFKDLLEKNVSSKYYYTEAKYPVVYSRIIKYMTNRDTIYQYRRGIVRENKSSLCPTLTAQMGTGGHNVPLLIDSKGIRKLTPRECFNFQGFPQSLNIPKDIADSHLYKIAGNSVPVPVIKRIAYRIKKSLGDSN